MDIHTNAYVKLLLSPRQSRGITHFIYPLKTNHKMRKQLTFFTLILIGYPASRVQR